jgi:dihydroorotate dehydrogenase
MDKDGQAIDGMGALGFGFLELGTVTPRPQPGNPRPRVFRLPQAEALINRMGFPNAGVQHLVERIKRKRYRGVCGVNIGKNADTPIENAYQDYVHCLRVVAPYADYVVLNISSPNTQGLRSLHESDRLKEMLAAVLQARAQEVVNIGHALPVLVKISPDLNDEVLVAVADLLKEFAVDGVIATNTTVSRPTQVEGLVHASETGGLSGQPLRQLSMRTISAMRQLLGQQFPIIGVGGIASTAQALEAIRAGANLVQLYSALIYRGPGVVRELVEALRAVDG